MNNLVKLILIDTVAKPLIGAVVNRVSSKVAGKRPEPQEPPMTINGLQELQQLQQGKKDGAIFPEGEKAQVYEAITTIYNQLEHIKTLVKEA